VKSEIARDEHSAVGARRHACVVAFCATFAVTRSLALDNYRPASPTCILKPQEP